MAHYRDEKTTVEELAKIYTALKCNRVNKGIDWLSKYEDDLIGFNYIKGYYYKVNDDYDKAVKHFYNEIELNPGFDKSYKQIALIHKKENSDSLDNFMTNDNYTFYLPYSWKKSFYYEEGYIWKYLKLIYLKILDDFHWMIFLVAFSVSFAWVVFLRMMDIYKREKWRDILIVFILAALMTNICLAFYDYATYDLNWKLDGTFWNDFMYCTVVIGGSEELVKFLPWILFAFFAKKLKEPYDYILYASVAALGFAFIENLTYFQNYNNITIRTIMSTVAHMFCASIVAFSFIYANYRFKGQRIYQVLVVLVGFFLAMLAHGFYDFWLISNAVNDYAFITTIFFVISLHIWFYFKNNAMNHSPFFRGGQKFNVLKQQDLLNITVIGALTIHYILISYEFGARYGNSIIISNGIIVAVFILYMSFQLDNLAIEKKLWNRLSFSTILPFKKIGNFFKRVGESTSNNGKGGFIGGIFGRGSYNFHYNQRNKPSPEERNLSGLSLRLFAPKSNPYIGSDLPVSGTCIRKVTVSGNPNWYVFKLNKKITFNDFVDDHIILKNKDASQSLLVDRIEVYFMFIPRREMLSDDTFDISELRYADRCYSRPLV